MVGLRERRVHRRRDLRDDLRALLLGPPVRVGHEAPWPLDLDVAQHHPARQRRLGNLGVVFLDGLVLGDTPAYPTVQAQAPHGLVVAVLQRGEATAITADEAPRVEPAVVVDRDHEGLNVRGELVPVQHGRHDVALPVGLAQPGHTCVAPRLDPPLIPRREELRRGRHDVLDG